MTDTNIKSEPIADLNQQSHFSFYRPSKQGKISQVKAGGTPSMNC